MMRLRVLALPLVMLMSACSGGQPPGNDNGAATNAARSDSQAEVPIAEVVPQDPAVRAEWLHVGCVFEGKRPAFTIAGQAASRQEFTQRLTEYGKRKDPGTGLPGEAEPGISDNPVVLQAKWSDHGGVLFEVMDCCGNAGTRRLVLDLGTRRFRCDLPTATNLPPMPLPPPDPSFPKDGDGLPDSAMGQLGMRSIRIIPAFSAERGVYGFLLKERGVETPVIETAFEIKKLTGSDGSIDATLWKKLRNSLTAALEKLEVAGHMHEVSVVVANKGSKFDDPQWSPIAVVGIGIDAVDYLNARRKAQGKPMLSLTFRAIG